MTKRGAPSRGAAGLQLPPPCERRFVSAGSGAEESSLPRPPRACSGLPPLSPPGPGLASPPQPSAHRAARGGRRRTLVRVFREAGASGESPPGAASFPAAPTATAACQRENMTRAGRGREASRSRGATARLSRDARRSPPPRARPPPAARSAPPRPGGAAGARSGLSPPGRGALPRLDEWRSDPRAGDGEPSTSRGQSGTGLVLSLLPPAP